MYLPVTHVSSLSYTFRLWLYACCSRSYNLFKRMNSTPINHHYRDNLTCLDQLIDWETFVDPVATHGNIPGPIYYGILALGEPVVGIGYKSSAGDCRIHTLNPFMSTCQSFTTKMIRRDIDWFFQLVIPGDLQCRWVFF